MANSLLTIGMITRESLRTLEGNLQFAKHVRRDLDDYYARSGAKIGNTVNARVPPIYTLATGPALSLQDTEETQVPVTLSTQAHVDIYFTTLDLTLSVDDFMERFVKQGIARIASQIDADGLAQWKNVNNVVGTPGTTPNGVSYPLSARQKLNENLAPVDNQRALVIDPGTEASLVGALTNIFNPQETIAKQYLNGSMGRALGFKWDMDPQVNSATIGAVTGTLTVLTAPVAGATSIVLAGFAASTNNVLNQGDAFTIAGVFNVNAQTKAQYRALKQFVVTSTGNNSDASGHVTVSVSPAFNDSSTAGAQNISALPAAAASVTAWGVAGTVSPQSLAFHKEAFVLVSADLELAGMGDFDGRISDKDLGVSLRIIRVYDINTDRKPCRTDVLYGWQTLRPEYACRVAA